LNTESLVYALRSAGFLTDDRVAAAFLAVPRALFLPETPPQTVYKDVPVYTRTDDRGGFLGGSDAPSQTAQLLQLAGLERGQNVLHIGTGTGYTAALIHHIVGEGGNVTTLEIDKETTSTARDHLSKARRSAVHVVHADGAGGYAPRASYDRIISSVALWDVPATWVRQTRPDGRIVTPLFLDGLQIGAAFTVEADGTLAADDAVSCSFVPILGTATPPMQHLYLGGGSALRLYSNEVRTLDSARLHLLMSNDAERCHLGAGPSAQDYWDGFVPYLMMNVPDGYDFVCYAVEGGKLVYGLSGRGFGLIATTSATFVGAKDMGDTHCFAGVDAFLEVDRIYRQWEADGKPRIDTLRVRLWPRPATDDEQGRLHEQGYVYQRPQHQLHVYRVTGVNSSHDDESAGE
jgi:protein-L-isoaspartate(D-aspartate) O-methyltransferase